LSGVSASLWPAATLDSEDSFEGDPAVGSGKKKSGHAGGREDMEKQAKNVDDAVNIIHFVLRNAQLQAYT